jgi:hypothetical protein
MGRQCANFVVNLVCDTQFSRPLSSLPVAVRPDWSEPGSRRGRLRRYRRCESKSVPRPDAALRPAGCVETDQIHHLPQIEPTVRPGLDFWKIVEHEPDRLKWPMKEPALRPDRNSPARRHSGATDGHRTTRMRWMLREAIRTDPCNSWLFFCMKHC